MIPIKKDFDTIPNCLKSNKAETAFAQNKTAYVDTNSSYSCVRQDLKTIYNDKCGYCEKGIADEREPIEHYRPKKGKTPYFWLAYSWDNLLLSCDKCNSHKGSRFPIKNEHNRIKSDNLSFDQIHSQIQHYNKIEAPLIINPEQETNESLNQILTFDFHSAEIQAKNNNNKMQRTIDFCGLNRPTLRKFKRLPIVNDLKRLIRLFKETHKEDLNAYINALKSIKQKLKEECEDEKQEFLAYRRFILENFNELLG